MYSVHSNHIILIYLIFYIISVCEIHERPIYIEIGKKDSSDHFSVAKVNLFEFSACGQYLAVRHELYPTTLWIWDIFTDYLDYLLLENPITGRLLKYQSTRPFKNDINTL